MHGQVTKVWPTPPQVDISTWKSKVQRVHVQIKDLCAILCALVVAQDYRRGQALVQHRSFKDNAAFFQARLQMTCPARGVRRGH